MEKIQLNDGTYSGVESDKFVVIGVDNEDIVSVI